MIEYAVRNPYNREVVITVKDNSLENAQKMKALIPETTIVTREVSEWKDTDL